MATRDGILDNLPWNVGERVTSGSPLAVVLAGKAPFARVYVPERYRVKIKVGDELLSTYGLDQKANQLAGSMSGGQRQRLGLAAATLHKPELLFLDEPTSAVDPENRRDFWEKLFDLCDQGTSILVSTH